jgi:hypothetical protein
MRKFSSTLVKCSILAIRQKRVWCGMLWSSPTVGDRTYCAAG